MMATRATLALAYVPLGARALHYSQTYGMRVLCPERLTKNMEAILMAQANDGKKAMEQAKKRPKRKVLTAEEIELANPSFSKRSDWYLSAKFS